MFGERLSPGRSYTWSLTLAVDWLTGVNYGFLLHRSEAASTLDYLSDTRWLYLVELNGLAIVFFALLCAPFAIASLVNLSRR